MQGVGLRLGALFWRAIRSGGPGCLFGAGLLLGSLGVVGTAAAADTTTLTVTATMPSMCQFVSVPALDFGNLVPAPTAGTVTASTTASFWCTQGSFYFLSVGDGLYYSGSRRMRGPGPTDYIPYSLSPAWSLGFGAGVSTLRTVTFTGNVTGPNYRNAAMGAYSDTVQLSITP